MRKYGCLFGIAMLTLWLSACGYIGPVQPPSPRIPVAVRDLKVQQVGGNLQWSFTLPSETTDRIDIDSFHLIELRVGADIHPFDFGAWLSGSSAITIPPSQTADEVNNRQMNSETPIGQWEGKEVAVAVRTAERKQRFSQWSNIVHLRVIQPLTEPVFQADSDAKGVKITLKAAPEGAKVRILRQGPNDTAPVEAGVAEGAEFIDTGAEYGTKYVYTAIAFNNDNGADAVSKPSEAVPITPKDTFPPEVPANVTALPGPNSIEISWERSPAPDIKGYYVFRSINGGPSQQIGKLTELPTYSDSDVKHGNQYRYQINAVDQHNNPSERSAPVTVTY
jgi:hypothetical protein